jgi:flagellar hook-associated protein 3 FlgL
MRVNPNMVPDILADLQQSQTAVNTTLQEVATGKSVNVPSDNPAASATMVQNTIETANVDQYTQNVSGTLSMLQTADSSIGSVVTSLTQAVSLGTEGANGTTNATDLQEIATQVQGILASVVAQANTAYQGAYLFGGTETSSPPYTASSSSASGYAYNGNSDTNSVAVGDDMNVQVNLPGSQIFSNSNSDVLGSLSTLVSALQSGNSSQIQTATSGVTTALNNVTEQRVFYGNAESQLNLQETSLQQETVNLTSQASSLIDVNEAQAATELSQAETTDNAAEAAAAKVLPDTLLSFLVPPQ